MEPFREGKHFPPKNSDVQRAEVDIVGGTSVEYVMLFETHDPESAVVDTRTGVGAVARTTRQSQCGMRV